MKGLLYLITIVLVATIAGCGSKPSKNPRLTRIYDLSESDPTAALAALDSVCPEELSSSDRYYYGFLKIKVNDKNYIRHTSDSLYLVVSNYYSDNKTMLPEVLYYGGRIYSDIGDYPTAIQYFQDALDAVPENDLNLRGHILSQTGRLLSKVRLYDQAIPYIQQVLHIDSIHSSPCNLLYNFLLLGYVYFYKEDFEQANIQFLKAKEWANRMSCHEQANVDVWISETQRKTGKIKEALATIRSAMDSVTPGYRNLALTTASHIYLESGIEDTAFICAVELANSQDPNNRHLGYECLLSPALLHLSPSDSLVAYVRRYQDILEDRLNSHDAQETLIQNAFYNYSVHQRQSFEAERSRNKMLFIVLICVCTILILLIWGLSYRYKSTRYANKLYQAQKLLDTLTTQLCIPMCEVTPDPCHSSSCQVNFGKLRENLIQGLLTLQTKQQEYIIPPIITQSNAYVDLQKYIAQCTTIPNNHPLWQDLEDIVLKSSPMFMSRLRLLIGHEPSMEIKRTSILIKCGVSPSQIAHLTSCSKEGVSSRRRRLRIHIFGQSTEIQTIDKVIRLL